MEGFDIAFDGAVDDALVCIDDALEGRSKDARRVQIEINIKIYQKVYLRLNLRMHLRLKLICTLRCIC